MSTIPEQIAAMSTESLMRLRGEICDELDRRYREAKLAQKRAAEALQKREGSANGDSK